MYLIFILIVILYTQMYNNIVIIYNKHITCILYNNICVIYVPYLLTWQHQVSAVAHRVFDLSGHMQAL